jgi:hypothetical protein
MYAGFVPVLQRLQADCIREAVRRAILTAEVPVDEAGLSAAHLRKVMAEWTGVKRPRVL